MYFLRIANGIGQTIVQKSESSAMRRPKHTAGCQWAWRNCGWTDWSSRAVGNVSVGCVCAECAYCHGCDFRVVRVRDVLCVVHREW